MEQKKKHDTQRRNWVFTINNPIQSEKELLEYLRNLPHAKFGCFGRERGDGYEDNEDGTIHFQGYIEFDQPKWFSTIKGYLSEPNVVPNAHIEPRKGTRKQARDYVYKVGTYAYKAHTLIGEVYSFGEWVDDGERSDLNQLKDLIEEGATDIDLAETVTSTYARHLQFVDRYRQAIQKELFGRTRRLDLEVVYIHGSSGVGKTRHIMDKYGDGNVYRVTDYDNKPFDNYDGEDIVVFEEFRSQVKIDIMLNWLDIYPVKLPARYHNKVACYTKVFVVSNWKPSEQYKKVQTSHSTTWRAFTRRFHKVYDFDISKTEPIPKEFAFGELLPVSDEELPF